MTVNAEPQIGDHEQDDSVDLSQLEPYNPVVHAQVGNGLQEDLEEPKEISMKERLNRLAGRIIVGALTLLGERPAYGALTPEQEGRVKEITGSLYFDSFVLEFDKPARVAANLSRTFGQDALYFDAAKDPNAVYFVWDVENMEFPRRWRPVDNLTPEIIQARSQWAVGNYEDPVRELLRTKGGTLGLPAGTQAEDAPYIEVITTREVPGKKGVRVFGRAILPQSAEARMRKEDLLNLSSAQMKEHTPYPKTGGSPDDFSTVLTKWPRLSELVQENYELARKVDSTKLANRLQEEHGPFLTEEQALSLISPKFAEYAQTEIPIYNWFTDHRVLGGLGTTEQASEIIQTDLHDMHREAIWTHEKLRNHIYDVIEANLDGKSFLMVEETKDHPTFTDAAGAPIKGATISYAVSNPLPLAENWRIADLDKYRPTILLFYEGLAHIILKIKEQQEDFINSHDREKELTEMLRGNGHRLSPSHPDYKEGLINKINNAPTATPLDDLGGVGKNYYTRYD